MEREDHSPPPQEPDIPNQLRNPRKKKSKNKDRNERRFTDEQLRSLESIFKFEKKLHPRKKMELAREVGLQPRQVAIWFQNKRARWKSKQIEEDYRRLKANYEDLCARFESLKNEKQSLIFQLQELRDMLKQSREADGEGKDFRDNSSDGGGYEFNGNTSCLNEAFSHRGDAMYSDDGREKGEELELVIPGERVDDSLASPEKLCRLDSVGLLDQSCGSSNWWDIWA